MVNINSVLDRSRLPRHPHKQEVLAIALYRKTPFVGWNSARDGCRAEWIDGPYRISVSRHAEAHAISQLPHDCDHSKVRLYVARFKKNGQKGMARPCKACAERIRLLGIKKVYYTNDSGEWERYNGAG